MNKILKHIISGLILAISSCQTDLDYRNIKVLPNQGIEIKGTLFQLDKTTYKQTLLFFNIKDTLFEYSTTAMVYDLEGNSLPCEETAQKRIDYQNVSFYFTGHRSDSLKLDIIEVRLNDAVTVSLDGKQIENSLLKIPAKYPNSIRFPFDSENIHETIFMENTSDYGITFSIDSIQNSIKLNRLFIQKKITKLN